MGLGKELAKFHRIDGVRLFTPQRWQALWPERAGIPPTAYVARRTDFDQMLLTHAAAAGAQIRQSCPAVAPLMEAGRVAGVVVRDDSETERVIRADVVIAADGVYSPIKRALAPKSSINGPTAVAIRAEMPACRADDNYYEIHARIKHLGNQLPGYGWVFPLGDGRINVGIGYMTSYGQWQKVNAAAVMEDLLHELPAEWDLPALDTLRRSKALRAWRLPTGFNTWPPHLPGVMFAGDAAGTVKPSNGAGISKALQSGILAGRCAVEAIAAGGPGDLSDYSKQLSRLWGMQYRIGRAAGRIGGYPRVMKAATDLLDKPWVRKAGIWTVYGRSGLAGYTEGR